MPRRRIITATLAAPCTPGFPPKLYMGVIGLLEWRACYRLHLAQGHALGPDEISSFCQTLGPSACTGALPSSLSLPPSFLLCSLPQCFSLTPSLPPSLPPPPFSLSIWWMVAVEWLSRGHLSCNGHVGRTNSVLTEIYVNVSGADGAGRILVSRTSMVRDHTASETSEACLAQKPSHHCADGSFTNPWDTWKVSPFVPYLS